MKKIALVSCYFKHNFGSQLQAFALQDFLSKNGYNVENIDVEKLNDFSKNKKEYYKKNFFNFKFILSKLGMLKLIILKKFFKKSNFKIRDNKFNEFKHNFKLSKKFSSYDELSNECIDRYTDVIVGSDQLWLPVNVFADYYTLNWVPNSVNKISYSTSLGINYIPKKYAQKYETFLKRINHLSVRENKAKELIEKNFDLEAKVNCDPTFLLSCDEWLKLTGAKHRINEKYIFVYFLGKNKKHWDFVKKLKEKTGFKIVSLNHCDEYFRYADKCCDISLYDVNPFDFIDLIHFAEYVCTDSFHGSVFSILNNKDFFTFRRFSDKKIGSTNSRIYSLLGKFDLENRLLYGNENIDDVLTIKTNYNKINAIIADYRNESIKWLLKSLANTKKEIVRVDELKKWECCGCGSCYNICPKKAISMIPNDDGFLHPMIDNEKCINCGLCINTCAFNKNQNYNNAFQSYGFVVQHKDLNILKESTSGGAFTAFANTIINNGGVVYGVKLNSDYTAIHVKATSLSELSQFRNSKYVQSNTGSTFKEVKELLNRKVQVLYSGTICQIEGLLAYLNCLNVSIDNLYTCEVICHDVVSPLVLKKYMSYQNKKRNGIDKIVFRDKTIYGYNWSNLTLYKEGIIKYHNGLDMDIYLKMMFDGISIRKSCSSCSFKRQERHSDLIIWDCFDVRNYDSTMNNNKGATKVLINSQKGEKLFFRSSNNLYFKQFSYNELTHNNYEMFNKPYESPKREMFFKDLNLMNEKKLFKKYGKITLKDKFINFIKLILIKTGLYSIIKSKKLAKRKN